jgi:hypothetical protein
VRAVALFRLLKPRRSLYADMLLALSFNHYKVELESLSIHFLHHTSERKDAIPLILCHGWPGSSLPPFLCPRHRSSFPSVRRLLPRVPLHDYSPHQPGHRVGPGLPRRHPLYARFHLLVPSQDESLEDGRYSETVRHADERIGISKVCGSGRRLGIYHSALSRSSLSRELHRFVISFLSYWTLAHPSTFPHSLLITTYSRLFTSRPPQLLPRPIPFVSPLPHPFSHSSRLPPPMGHGRRATRAAIQSSRLYGEGERVLCHAETHGKSVDGSRESEERKATS